MNEPRSPPPNGPPDDDNFRERFQGLFDGTLKFLRRRYGNVQGLGQDTQAARGALWSAYESLRRHHHDGKFEELSSEADYVGEFARITFNHWRRKDRKESRVVSASQLGPEGQGPGPGMLEQTAAAGASPEDQAMHNELRERISAAVERSLGRLRPGEGVIVREYLKDTDRNQTGLAAALGVRQWTVSRAWTRFLNFMRGELQEYEREDTP